MDTIIVWVRAILTTTPRRWTNLVETLPIELLSRRPASQEWSAVECLLHLVDTEQVITVRIKAFLAGQDFSGFYPDQEGTKLAAAPSPQELAQKFTRMRVANLDLLEEVGPEDLARTAHHSELGIVTMNEMLHEWAGHDLMHTVQAERALMQPFINSCGPWKVYFTDHVAKAG